MKPQFHGIRWDWQTGTSALTVLVSRVNAPRPAGGRDPTGLTTLANLIGGHLVRQIGREVTLGVTALNVHNGNTQEAIFTRHPLRGRLPPRQREAIRQVLVRLTDDSPEDGQAGARLIEADLRLTGLDGRVMTGRALGLRPRVEGGIVTPTALTVEGGGAIVLTWDLADLTGVGLAPAQIQQVVVELMVANDYRIELASDRQMDPEGVPVFLPAARAPGNVRDGTNRRTLRLSVGLPTAQTILGVNGEVRNWHDLWLQGEWAQSRRTWQYPVPRRPDDHVAGRTGGQAGDLTATYRGRRLLGTVEVFAIDETYQTAFFLPRGDGSVNYRTTIELFEFVDDNDDQDRFPDWSRLYSGAGRPEEIGSPPDFTGRPDPAVYPGYDENLDFISDRNQNDNPQRPNTIPDDEEPFLRYGVDSPVFLPGLDMNHNGTIDRFENDTLPDYPYKPDHRGWHAYARITLRPGVRFTVGSLHERLELGARRSQDRYGLLTVEEDHPPWGVVRVFGQVHRIWDDLPDDLLPPVGLLGSAGDGWGALIRDPLVFRNGGWQLGGYADWTIRREDRLFGQVKAMADAIRRRTAPDGLTAGLIARGDLVRRIGKLRLTPRLKVDLLRTVPPNRQEVRSTMGHLLLSPMVAWPFLTHSRVEGGIEWRKTRILAGPEAGVASEWVWVVQMANVSSYLGYKVTTHVGLRWERRRTFDETGPLVAPPLSRSSPDRHSSLTRSGLSKGFYAGDLDLDTFERLYLPHAVASDTIHLPESLFLLAHQTPPTPETGQLPLYPTDRADGRRHPGAHSLR
jgi:hypothetical protein